jgi:Flp pilus assembly protein TadG
MRRQSGAELVEFFFVFPSILVVLFLIIELGVGFANQAVLTQASRAGAREAIRCIGDPTAQSCQDRVEEAVRQVAQSDTVPNPNDELLALISWTKNPATEFQVDSIELDTSKSECTATPPAVGCPITVRVTYDFDFLLLPELPAWISPVGDIVLSAKTTMRKVRD